MSWALLRALAAGAALVCGVCTGAAEAPQRIVAVGGVVTEIAFALGRGDRLVAVDSTSTFPDAAKALPRVGYMRTLSAEGVLAVDPKLILATDDAGPPSALAQLRSAGVPVVSITAEHSFQAVLAKVHRIGEALDAEGPASEMERQLTVRWRQTTARVAALPDRARVLFLLAHSSNNLLVSGTGTAADAMIRLAGGVNALSGFSGYKPLTAEAAAAAAPDVLLITREGVAQLGTDHIWTQPGLALTPAGRNRRLVSMDALYLLGFGPRLPEAVRDLADQIHRS